MDGSEMIVWGATTADILEYRQPVQSGYGHLGRTHIDERNVRRDRYAPAAVMDRPEMIVWGGYGAGYLNTGGGTSATNTWGAPTSTSGNLPSARDGIQPCGPARR